MSDQNPRLHRIISAVVVLYASSVLLLLAVSFLIPRPEARGILRTVFSLLLFPALIFLPLMLLLRRWRLSVLLLPFVVAWTVVYGSLLIPRGATPPADAFRFTILTFNVQIASENLDSISQLIADVNADIVAVQELSEPAAQHFETVFATQYPHRALHPSRNPHWGQGVMSRFPIDEHEYWRNEAIDVALGHMWAELDLDGQPITIFSTHPVPPLSFEKGITLQPHSQEIEILLERAAQRETPLVLVGDFNMTQLMDEYQRVTRTYIDTFREAGQPGLGFTFPAGSRFPLPPVVRLDYIFTRPTLWASLLTQ
ncbi:MAG: hypothetical protein HC828_13840 [Blastochloris sp.]|nr:hypothetical protein [Blastochloris sp.]